MKSPSRIQPQTNTLEDVVAVAQEHRTRLLRIAARYVPADDAEDVLQTTLARVARNGIVPGTALLPWLEQGVRRDALNHLDAARVRDEATATFLDLESSPRPVSPEQLELRVDLSRALAALPDDQRRAVEALIVHGLTVREVAAEEGVSHVRIHQRVQAGLAALRARLS